MNEIIINNNDGTLTVPSTQVAENFGKRHCDVIKMWRKPIGLPMGCKPQNFCKKF